MLEIRDQRGEVSNRGFPGPRSEASPGHFQREKVENIKGRIVSSRTDVVDVRVQAMRVAPVPSSSGSNSRGPLGPGVPRENVGATGQLRGHWWRESPY